MDQPIYVYYQLDNFYQNHRRYAFSNLLKLVLVFFSVPSIINLRTICFCSLMQFSYCINIQDGWFWHKKTSQFWFLGNSLSTTLLTVISESRYVKSRNDAQLKDADQANKTSGCDPEKTTKDGSPIVPCGLIAWSLFNDTYNFTLGNKNLSVNKNGISWKSDRDHKFGKDVYPKNFQNGTLRGGASLDLNKPVRLHSIISCFSLASYFLSVCLVCVGWNSPIVRGLKSKLLNSSSIVIRSLQLSLLKGRWFVFEFFINTIIYYKI